MITLILLMFLAIFLAFAVLVIRILGPMIIIVIGLVLSDVLLFKAIKWFKDRKKEK